MVIFVGGVFAVSQSVPEFDFLVGSGGDNLSVVWGERDGEDLLGVSVELSGAFGLLQVPESEGFVPRSGDNERVILGNGDIGDEVGMSSQGSVGISVVAISVLFFEAFPDDDFFVSGS